MATGDDKRLVSQLNNGSDNFRMALGSAEIESEDEFIELIKRRKFPSHRNFEHLFESVGLSDINRKLSRRIGRTNFRLALKSLVDVRNALAHESPPPVTHADVIRHIRDMRKWIGAIDREIYSHIVKSSGPAYW